MLAATWSDLILVAQIIEISGSATRRKSDCVPTNPADDRIAEKIATYRGISRSGMFENPPHSFYDTRWLRSIDRSVGQSLARSLARTAILARTILPASLSFFFSL